MLFLSIKQSILQAIFTYDLFRLLIAISIKNDSNESCIVIDGESQGEKKR